MVSDVLFLPPKTIIYFSLFWDLLNKRFGIKLMSTNNSSFVNTSTLLMSILLIWSNSIQWLFITFIKLLSLLWISYIQHRQYPDVNITINNNNKYCLRNQLGITSNQFEILKCYERYPHADLTECYMYCNCNCVILCMM